MTHFHEKYDEVSRKLEEKLNAPNLHVFGRVNVWLTQGALPEEILELVPRIAKQGYWRGNNLNYFDGFIADAIAARTKPMPKPSQRADRPSTHKRDSGYEPPAELSSDVRDKIDQGNARLINKGITVMSVTYADAERMHRRGWLSDEAAERFGLRKEAV